MSDNKEQNRISAFDLARFLAMLMMMQGHTVFALASPEMVDATIFPWNVWDFMRGITAPVFLFISGASYVFANKRQADGILPQTTVKRRIKLAISLIVLSYLMHFPVERIYDLAFLDPKLWENFFRVNILQVIGVSLVLVTLAFAQTKDDKSVGILSFFIGAFILIISPFIEMISWFELLPSFFASYISYERGSIFTLFPFTAFMFLGVAFGAYIKQLDKSKRSKFLFNSGLAFGIPLVAMGYGIMQLEGFIGQTLYAKYDPGLAIIRLGFVFLWLAIVSKIADKTKFLNGFYSLFGKRALFIYVIHLVVIYGSPLFNGLNKFYANSLYGTDLIVSVLFVTSITMAITYLIHLSLSNYPKIGYFLRYSLTASVIYWLFI